MKNKPLNLKIYELKEELIKIINNSDLDPGVIYYLIKDFFHAIEEQYFDIVKKEYNLWLSEEMDIANEKTEE